MLSVQEVDDGVGIGAGETVREDGDTAVRFDGDVAEQQSRTARNRSDGRESDGRLVIADQFLLAVRDLLGVFVNNQLIREHHIPACHSAC